MSELKKPEKRPNKPYYLLEAEKWVKDGYNEACDEWQAYHTQEVKEYRKRIEKGKTLAWDLQTSVDELNKKIKALEDEVEKLKQHWVEDDRDLNELIDRNEMAKEAITEFLYKGGTGKGRRWLDTHEGN